MLRYLTIKYTKLNEPMKASLWFFFCSVLQSGISTITTPIFTRLLSTTEYGVYSVFMSWQSIFTVFIGLNIYSAVYTQALVKFDSDRNVLAASMQGLLLILCIVWGILYSLFSVFFNNITGLSSVQVYILIAMVYTSSVFNLWATEERNKFKYKSLVFFTILASVLKPILSVLLVIYCPDKVIGRILGIVCVEILLFSWIPFYEIKKGACFYSKKYWNYVLLLTIPLIPHYLSQTLLSTADRIMIQDLIGYSQAGIYSLAYSIAQLMTLFSAAMIQTINPWIFRKIKQKKLDDIAPVGYCSLAFIAILNLVLIAFAPEAVKVFASNEYYDAIWIIPPIAMSVFFMFSYSLFATFEFYFEKTHYIAVSTVCSAILNIVLNYYTLPRYGYFAAGYTTLLCYFLYALFHYMCMILILRKNADRVVVYDFNILLIITVAFITIGFLLLFSYFYNYIRAFIIMLAILFSLCKRRKICEIFMRLYRMRNGDI